MEYLDQQLSEVEEQEVHDIFDAGVTLPGEENEQSHDHFEPRTRTRRTAIFIGHGDFMSLVLKRIVAGFGHAIEKESVPHRSAFVHVNTGITDLEYFGHGRFLVMSQNHMPHLAGPDSCYITGGSLKDGWSYVMPRDGCLDSEVTVAFSDEVLPHVQEQTEALRSLYLSKKGPAESGDGEANDNEEKTGNELTIVVKRGLQVVGCASLNEKTGRLSDVVVRPSARRSQVGENHRITRISGQPEWNNFFRRRRLLGVKVSWADAPPRFSPGKQSVLYFSAAQNNRLALIFARKLSHEKNSIQTWSLETVYLSII